MAKLLDYDIVVNELEMQSLYYVHFQTNTLGKGMNPLIPPIMSWIVLLQPFYKDGFDVKYLTKIGISLNKEIRWFKKFHLGYKILNDQSRTVWSQTVDSEYHILQGGEVHTVSSTRKLPDKRDIS